MRRLQDNSATRIKLWWIWHEEIVDEERHTILKKSFFIQTWIWRYISLLLVSDFISLSTFKMFLYPVTFLFLGIRALCYSILTYPVNTLPHVWWSLTSSIFLITFLFLISWLRRMRLKVIPVMHINLCFLFSFSLFKKSKILYINYYKVTRY